MAPAWSGSDSPMARLMNSLPKLVFTSSEPEFEWANSRVSAGPLEEEIAALKAEDGRDLICIGGAAMARSLTRLGLVDEYRVTVHPVVLGDGKKFWPELPGARRLPTIGTTAFADGSVVHQLAGVGHLSSAG
jgi:dihydrofolate reductase